MIYIISLEAEKDLESIWLYTFKSWSLEQANYYYDLIIDHIVYLSENPKIGDDYSIIRKGYFRTRIKSHFIFYKINLESNKLEIIRILGQQMDFDSILIK